MGAADHEAEFRALFSRSIEMTGDAYFVADESEVRAEYQRLVALRGAPLPSTFDISDPKVVSKLLSPSAALRIKEWEKLREAKQAPDGTYLADIEHNAHGKAPASGWLHPTMDTHALIYSWSAKRMGVGMEQFGVHGLHVHPPTMVDWQCPFVELLKSLSPAKQRFLVGNSLLLPAVAAFVWYIMSNLQCRDVITPMPRVINNEHRGEGDDDDLLDEPAAASSND